MLRRKAEAPLKLLTRPAEASQNELLLSDTIDVFGRIYASLLDSFLF